MLYATYPEHVSVHISSLIQIQTNIYIYIYIYFLSISQDKYWLHAVVLRSLRSDIFLGSL
jgi:hypothetical protein